MKKIIYLLLLLPSLSWGQSQSVTMQFRSFGQRYPMYTWSGIPGGGYDTLWNAQTIRGYVNNKNGYIQSYLKAYADSLYARTVNLFDTQSGILGNKSFSNDVSAANFFTNSGFYATSGTFGGALEGPAFTIQNSANGAFGQFRSDKIDWHDIFSGGIYSTTFRPTQTALSGDINIELPHSSGILALQSELLMANYVNVLSYGADSTAVNKSDTPFKLAIAAAVSQHINTVYVPSGNYKLDSLLILPSNISLIGANSNYTTIRASGAYANYLTPDPVPIGTDGLIHAFVYSTGGLTSKGKLTVAVTKGDYFVRANTGLGLLKGDIIKIVDTTSFSYSKFRSYYREGEFFQVIRYASDTIYLDHPSRANFANVSSAFIYKLTPTTQKIQDITIKGLQAQNMTTVFIDNAEGTDISRVNLYNGARSNLSIRGGYNIKIDHMKTLLDTGLISPYPATSYGISLIACQKVSVTHSILYAYQHAFTASSSTGYYGVVNRDIILDDIFAYSRKPSFPGIDFHGDAEYCEVTNSTSNGVEFGGSNFKIAHNKFNGGNELGATLYHIAMNEVKAPTFDIDDNRIELNISKESVSSRLFSMSADTLSGGTLKITNNHFSVNNTVGTITTLGLIETTGSIANTLNVFFQGNTMTNNSAQSSRFVFQGEGFGFNMGNLTLTGNILDKAKIESSYINRGVIKNNDIKNSFDSGIRLTRFSNLDFQDNSFDGFVLNPSVNPTGSERAAFSISFSDTVRVRGNSGTAAGTNAANAYVLSNIGTTLFEGEYQFGSLTPSRTSITGQDYWRFPNIYVMTPGASLPLKTASNNGLTAAAINLASSTEVTGTLAVNKGGTGKATITSGALQKGNGTSALADAIANTDYLPVNNFAATGIPTAPTAAAGTNTTQIATTAFVTTADNLKANIASPALTGVPTAPTAALNNNSTQLATTAYVDRIGATAGSFSGVGTATTTFTVTIGATQANTTYKVNATPTNLLSAAVFYITNKTTTTFDVVYLAGLTGTVAFDWSLFK